MQRVRRAVEGIGVKQISAQALGLPSSFVFAVRGDLPPPPRLAIVGSRAVQLRLVPAVDAIVAEAGARGWSIVSGGALGIDAAAHRSALKRGVPQVAVLPCGPERIYPPDHGPLFDQVARHGAVMFALPRNTPSSRAVFASRNRWVVELADAVVVAQASLRSGSMRTGQLARQRGRRLAVVLGSAGTAALVGAGAHALEWTHDDPTRLREDLGGWLDGRHAEVVWPSEFAPMVTRLVQTGRVGVDDFDDPIAAACLLADAESLGWVKEAEAGWFVATKPLPRQKP